MPPPSAPVLPPVLGPPTLQGRDRWNIEPASVLTRNVACRGRSALVHRGPVRAWGLDRSRSCGRKRLFGGDVEVRYSVGGRGDRGGNQGAVAGDGHGASDRCAGLRREVIRAQHIPRPWAPRTCSPAPSCAISCSRCWRRCPSAKPAAFRVHRWPAAHPEGDRPDLGGDPGAEPADRVQDDEETALLAAHGVAPSLPRLDRLQRLDPLEERTDGEVVGERLLVVTTGHPDLLAVGSVQPGVVPHNRPGRGGLAPLGRADRWALLAAHRASLAGGRDLQPGETRPSSARRTSRSRRARRMPR
jgi:hypothetical protein